MTTATSTRVEYDFAVEAVDETAAKAEAVKMFNYLPGAADYELINAVTTRVRDRSSVVGFGPLSEDLVNDEWLAPQWRVRLTAEQRA